MSEKNVSTASAPLSDADRELIAHARRRCISDEVLDVVVDRLARAIASMRDPEEPPALAITEVFPEAWAASSCSASVRFIDSPGVLARIG